MLKRRAKGQWPQVVFTSDFHELVRGDIGPGATCVLRYDPHRVVPEAEVAALPATQRPVTAHVRFHPSGALWEAEMRFPKASHMLADNDPTGSGTMLETHFPVHEGSDELEAWFSYVNDAGQTEWDSDEGRNHWLRFPSHDLEIATAKISEQPRSPFDQFELTVESVAAVDQVWVRWRYTRDIRGAVERRPLVAAVEGDRKRWTLPPESGRVASDSPISFDLMYDVAGRQFTDDNQGTWYVIARS